MNPSATHSRWRFGTVAARSIRIATHGATWAASRNSCSSTDAPASPASPAGGRLHSFASRDAPPSSAAVASTESLPALRARLVAASVLAVAFVALTMALAAGALNMLDKQVLQGMASLWSEPLHPLFQAIAELGGLEATAILMVGLAVFLIRGGFGADAWVVLVFVAAQVLEVLYKANLHHLGPPRSVSHADGPSLTELVSSTWPLARSLAIPVATAIIVLIAFDRLYLDVHWESDVVGGVLLGAIGLVAGTVWLDRPISTDN